MKYPPKVTKNAYLYRYINNGQFNARIWWDIIFVYVGKGHKNGPHSAFIYSQYWQYPANHSISFSLLYSHTVPLYKIYSVISIRDLIYLTIGRLSDALDYHLLLRHCHWVGLFRLPSFSFLCVDWTMECLLQKIKKRIKEDLSVLFPQTFLDGQSIVSLIGLFRCFLRKIHNL